MGDPDETRAFGAGYSRGLCPRDGDGPLQDSASQMFSLCIKWRTDSAKLTSLRLRELGWIWQRQVEQIDASMAQLQQFSSLLLQHLLEEWDLQEQHRCPTEHPKQRSNRTGSIQQLVVTMQGFWSQHVQTPLLDSQEAWRCAHCLQYCQFIQRSMQQLNQLELGVSPLKHVIGHYDPSLLVAGLWLEFGVAEGRTISLIAAALPQHCAVADEVVYGFDSFDGLPERWRPGFAAGHFEREGSQPPAFAAGTENHIRLVKGWFQETLPQFLEQHSEPVSMLHIDSDLYSSAVYVLEQLMQHGRLVPGTVIVFDELFHYCGFENHEFLALFEVMHTHGLQFDWIGIKRKGCMRAALVVRGFGAATPAPPEAANLCEAATVAPAAAAVAPVAPAAVAVAPLAVRKRRVNVAADTNGPSPSRCLPATLARGNSRLEIPSVVIDGAKADIVLELARALAEELLALDVGTGTSDEVYGVLERYQVTEQMKQTSSYKDKGKQDGGGQLCAYSELTLSVCLQGPFTCASVNVSGSVSYTSNWSNKFSALLF